MTAKPGKNRRDFIAYVFKTGLWAAVPTSGLLAPLVEVMAAAPRELAPGRSIFSFSGEVKVDGHLVTKSNMKDVQISATSTISTAARSRIIFAVGKDAHYLRANSEMMLEGKAKVERAMNLSQGKVLSVFAKRPRGSSPYRVNTPSAVIGIRGTGLYVEAEPEIKRSYICTCYGDVNISSSNNPKINEDIVASHHDQPKYVYADDANGGIIQDAPFKNHTDEELQLIETIVGRTTPYSSVKEAYPRPRKSY
ncbi:MAG: hypothetical protein ACJAVI_004270 [Candidatus Azotimanducaceae bacterium]